MQLTYTDSRAICIQDPNNLSGAPSDGDPFQSSFRSEATPAPSAAPAVHPLHPQSGAFALLHGTAYFAFPEQDRIG